MRVCSSAFRRVVRSTQNRLKAELQTRMPYTDLQTNLKVAATRSFAFITKNHRQARYKTMTRHALLFASFVLACTFHTPAQQRAKPAASAKKQPCAKAVTQAEMNQCAYDEYQKADAELNK